MTRDIIFYAPVGTGVPEHMLGGGEKGCRRTREILFKAGYNVITIDKPVMGNGMKKYVAMAIYAYITLLKLMFKNKSALVYVVGFYEKNVFIEWLNLITAKLLKHKTVYEARNGRLVKAYGEYGPFYKMIMKSVLKHADLIFVQGFEYIKFVKEKSGKDAVYTPNYVLDRSLLPYEVNRHFPPVRLLYFGRVSKSKNVDIVIKTAKILEDRGIETHTTIIGGYTSEYRNELDNLITKIAMPTSKISFEGQQNFNFISSELQKAHFFVFPSQEKMEGHSNSLTEAMTFGVVPVVSTAGFNRSIVSKDELIVEEMDAVKYANVIETVLGKGVWEEYSRYVYQRIKENYTEEKVKSSILDAINGVYK